MKLIKQILQNKGMSQNRLSQLSQVPQNMINQIVNNKLYPCPAWKRRIADTLEVPENILWPSDSLEVK